MHVTVNLQGLTFHVGFYRDGRVYRVDLADVYLADSAGNQIAEIDNIDRIGGHTLSHGWQSLRCLAEHLADQQSAQWDWDAMRAAVEMRHAEMRVA